jgi:hypothetical protein
MNPNLIVNSYNRHLQNLSRKGRKGDTALRKVKGQVSHVNKEEAQIIDWLGPLGEAWVQSIGSGTTNPKTGLKEYSHKWWHPKTSYTKKITNWFDKKKDSWWVGEDSWARSLVDDNNTWRPSQGKWGWFGQSYASRQRDKAKAIEKQREKQFEDWLADNKTVDVAEKYQTGDVENWLTAGTAEDATDASTMKTSEYERVIDEYDPRKQEEGEADWVRTQEAHENTMDDLTEGFSTASQAAGDKVAGQTFGLLTQASQVGGPSRVASAGNFGQEFALDQVLSSATTAATTADSTLGGGVRDAGLALEQDEADFQASIADIHDDFNTIFWTQLTNWNDAKTA